MAVSQDKVQGILETLLEESLPLVNKGIFTSEQLRQAMCEREKHENNMLKSTFKLSDYLAAIQYEYGLERLRRFRISKESQKSKGNILFKKQGKTDFVIVKRIIKVWDRIMHKFKYKCELWKQYLNFCIVIESKKHFFKALAHAVRFLPFELQLWKIGIRYLIEIEKNWWKARNLCHRALNMNNKKFQLWVYMFELEVEFMRNINKWGKQIEGKGEEMKIIKPDQSEKEENESQIQIQEQPQERKISIEQFDSVLEEIIKNCIERCSQKSYQEKIAIFQQILQNNLAKQDEKAVKKVLKKVLNMMGTKNEEKNKENEMQEKVMPKLNTYEQKCEHYKKYLSTLRELKEKQIDSIVNIFLNKPQLLSEILNVLLSMNCQFSIDYMAKKFKKSTIPNNVIMTILMKYYDNWNENLNNFLKIFVKKISVENLSKDPKLLSLVINYNKKIEQFKQNNRIHRSLSIHNRKEPEIAERCLHMIQNDLII